MVAKKEIDTSKLVKRRFVVTPMTSLIPLIEFFSTGLL